MRFPNTLYVGRYPLLLHSAFEFAGIFIAFRYYLWLKKKQGDIIQSERRMFVIIGASLGAVLGARVVGSLENLPAWINSASPWLYFFGNKTLVGGLVGGLAGVELVKIMIREKQNTGDLFTFPLLLGMIIGRLGCFFAGLHEETYGLPSHMPWALDLGDGTPRHPVTLYEILFLVLLWIVLARVKKNYLLFPGALFKMFLISYLLFRLCLDFIKPGWRYCFGLGTIQLVCIAGLLYYAKYILNPRSLIVSKREYAR